jgi:hypothetical protein
MSHSRPPVPSVPKSHRASSLGAHKVQIDLVDANHVVFPGQSKTVTFTVPPRSN